MDIEYRTKQLKRLAHDANYNARLDCAVVRAYRMRVQSIVAAESLADLYAHRSWRMEKLKGSRSHQYSIRLNKQWRLIVELSEGKAQPKAELVSIEDYH